MKQRSLVLSYVISVGFALFALLFGAGNLMYPVTVGRTSGTYMRILLLMLLSFSCLDAKNSAPTYRYTLEVNAQTIAPYIASIDSFLNTKRWQLRIMTNPIGSFFSSLYCSFSGIDPSEAKAFLTRTFADEAALKKAFTEIPKQESNMRYIQEIVNSLSSNDIRKKSTDKLPLIMKQKQHPLLKPGIKPWDKAKVPDQQFYQVAACNFLAYHLVESDGPARKKIVVTSSHTSQKPKPSKLPRAANTSKPASLQGKQALTGLQTGA